MHDFSNNEICIRLPCNHIFKLRPLLQWLSTARTCPMCRQNINSLIPTDSSNNTIDLTRNNVSIQTTNIDNGFIADVSGNNIDDLSAALTENLANRIQTLFQNIDLSNNNIPVAWSTDIQLVDSRHRSQSPINNLHFTTDNSGNVNTHI